ncbi:MAG: glycosyltransferase family 4 protein [Verrucomicrobiaceae bacterium]
MKITIIQGAFFPVPPLLGGAVEKMWFRLGKEFAAQGHEVMHLSRQHVSLPREEVIGGVQHRRSPGYDQPRSLLKLKLLDLLYSYRVCRQVPTDSDVVVTNTFTSPVLLSGALKSRAYVDIQRMPRGQCRWYQLAGRLRANSTPVAGAIQSEMPTSSWGKVSLIPNPLPFDPPEQIDLEAKMKRILYCGRVHPEKGLEILMRSAHQLSPEWSVHIVGPWEVGQGGGGKGYLEHLKTLAGGSAVHFHGPEFDGDKLALHYKSAAIFVYPSVAEQGETFGLAPLEAMAWGCVPVVSDLACFRDFIHPEQNGRIFNHRAAMPENELGHIMQELCAQPDLRHALAMQASQVQHSHHPRTIARLFLEDFEALTQGHPSPSHPSLIVGTLPK